VRMWQQTEIIGFLGADPRRAESNGVAVANFSVATTYKRGATEETVWYQVSAWDSLADAVLSWCQKGTLVHIVGRELNPRIYKTQDGETRADLRVRAYRIHFLRNTAGRPEATSAPRQQISGQFDDNSDEIPF